MKYDPATGPIPPAVFKALVDAPYGEAARAIQKYDPLFGKESEEEREWWVTFKRRATETGRATVKATTMKEAQELAEALSGREIEWDADWSNTDPGEVVSVEIPDL